MYSGHARLSVHGRMLSAHTTARARVYLGGMVGVPPSCALLGGFAIGARVALL